MPKRVNEYGPRTRPMTAQYRLYAEMRRLADSLFVLAEQCQQEADYDHAIECYREARELANICARFEKAPIRTLDATRGALATLDNRFALSDAKRRQHTELPGGPFPLTPINGGGGPTEEEQHDDA